MFVRKIHGSIIKTQYLGGLFQRSLMNIYFFRKIWRDSVFVACFLFQRCFCFLISSFHLFGSVLFFKSKTNFWMFWFSQEKRERRFADFPEDTWVPWTFTSIPMAGGHCWWQPEIRQIHQLRLVVYLIIYKVVYIPGGCLGFLNHQQYCFQVFLIKFRITTIF